MPSAQANFVLQQYRIADEADHIIKAKYETGARVVEFSTNTDEATATELAQKIMDANINPIVFEMPIEDLMDVGTFVGRPPQYALTLTERNIVNRPVRVIYTSMDLNTGMSNIEVRG